MRISLARESIASRVTNPGSLNTLHRARPRARLRGGARPERVPHGARAQRTRARCTSHSARLAALVQKDPTIGPEGPHSGC